MTRANFKETESQRTTHQGVKSPPSTHVQMLMQERAALMHQMDALRERIAGLDLAIDLISGKNVRTQSSRGRVTRTIIDLLGEAGETGLDPGSLISTAAARGIALNRGSVYALLNRLEHSGEVERTDGRFKLKQR